MKAQDYGISAPDVEGIIKALPDKIREGETFALANLLDPRFLIPSGSPDKIVVRFYFQRSYSLAPLADPSDSEIEKLRSDLKGVLNSATEPVADGSWNESDELTRASDALTAVFHALFLTGPLLLTPIPRPLIQLNLELLDTIHGRKSGLLHTVPSDIAATPMRRAKRNQGLGVVAVPSSKPDEALPPFQRLVQRLGASAEELALRRPERWLHACTGALTATIAYLSEMGFAAPLLAPLRTLEAPLLQMLHGRLCDLLHRRVWSDRFDALDTDNEGPRASKPDLLQRERFHAYMITAYVLHARADLPVAIERSTFNRELIDARIRERGRPVTYQSVKEARKRMWEDKRTLREKDYNVLLSALKQDGGAAASRATGELPVASFAVRQLLQMAILFEPPEPILKLSRPAAD